MSIVYLNGKYLPKKDATISIEDRGWLFADGIYEVVRCYRGRPFLIDRHLTRMRDSLAAIQIKAPVEEFAHITDQLLQRNHLVDARVYWQITRGVAPRQHAFPPHITPTVLAMADPAEPIEQTTPMNQGQAILEPDQRWAHCAIKSIMLLPSVLARQKAAEAGCIEAILHRDQVITEGAATSVFAVIDGELRTHPADGSILTGITRELVIERARQLNIPFREHPFTIDDLASATELFITGTTTHITAISHCGSNVYTNGPITQRLHHALIEQVLSQVSGGEPGGTGSLK